MDLAELQFKHISAASVFRRATVFGRCCVWGKFQTYHIPPMWEVLPNSRQSSDLFSSVTTDTVISSNVMLWNCDAVCRYNGGQGVGSMNGSEEEDLGFRFVGFKA